MPSERILTLSRIRRELGQRMVNALAQSIVEWRERRGRKIGPSVEEMDAKRYFW